MMLIEAAIAKTLQRSGPCCLDDLVTSLSSSDWGEAFAAVDRMSRDGRVVLHPVIILPIRLLSKKWPKTLHQQSQTNIGPVRQNLAGDQEGKLQVKQRKGRGF